MSGYGRGSDRGWGHSRPDGYSGNVAPRGNKREEQSWTESESNYGHQNRQDQKWEPRSYNDRPSYREPGGANFHPGSRHGDQYWSGSESNFDNRCGQGQEREPRSYNDRTHHRDSRGGNDYNQHNRTNSKERHYDNRGSHYRKSAEDDVTFSKSLSYLLRHGAEKQKLELLKGGFLYVKDILSRQQFRGFTLEDVQRIVASNDKKRFHIEFDEDVNKWKIRANQGHTMKVEDLALDPIFEAKDYPTVVHGTYLESWNKIRKTGLKTMGRNHIHFAPGTPGESGVISGMRKSCDVLIFLNLEKALKAGIKFFISANNVVLSTGNDHGIIHAEYFQTVVNRQTGALLSRDEDAPSMTYAAIQMAQQVDRKREQMMDKKKKKNKKQKGANENEPEPADTGTSVDELPERWDEPSTSENRATAVAMEDDNDAAQNEAASDTAIASVGSFQLVTDVAICQSIVSSILDSKLHEKRIALMCLGTPDKVKVITVADPDKHVYMFDVEENCSLMTEGQLQDLLESRVMTIASLYHIEQINFNFDETSLEAILNELKMEFEPPSVSMNVLLNQFEHTASTITDDERESAVTYVNTWIPLHDELVLLIPDEHKSVLKKSIFAELMKDLNKEDVKRKKEERKRKAKEEKQSAAQSQTKKSGKSKKKK